MTALALLTLDTLSRFEAMTFPYYRASLREAALPGSSCVAVAAWDREKPVGLALAQLVEDGAAGRVLSLYVERHARGHGLGTALLARVERELRLRGAAVARVRYTSGSPGAAALERVLEKRAWLGPRTWGLLFRCDGAVLAAPLAARIRTPAGCEVLPWAQASARDRAELECLQDSGCVPWDVDLRRHRDDPHLDPQVSQLLRCEGRASGWLLAHAIGPRTVRYSSLYVRAAPACQGAGLVLVRAAMERQRELYGDECQTSAMVPFSRARAARFWERRVGPWMREIREARRAMKRLEPAQQNPNEEAA